MKIGDQITHKSIGSCTVTHIWLRHLGVTPDDGCESEMIIIPRESAMEMSRLEMQARGMLDDVEVGDFVVEIKGSQLLWKVTGVRPGRMQTLPSGAQRYLWERLELKGNGFTGNVTSSKYRLATPAELLDAGVIDEIPGGDQPRDANGEVLEVGDIVEWDGQRTPPPPSIVTRFQRGDKFWTVRTHDGGNDYQHHWTKVTNLSHSNYLRLARRTLDPEMTRRERLGMLTRGVCGEYGEYISDPSAEEVGDLLWYATILADEIGKDGDDERWIEHIGLPIVWLHMNGNRRDEYIKKAIYHDVAAENLEEIAAEGLAVCHYAAEQGGLDIGEIRYRNIRKLIDRYPDGFVSGGGRR